MEPDPTVQVPATGPVLVLPLVLAPVLAWVLAVVLPGDSDRAGGVLLKKWM